jgi:hypothetical protein
MPEEWARREAQYQHPRDMDPLVKPEDEREYFEWLAKRDEIPATEEDRFRWEFNLLTPEDRREWEEWLRSSEGSLDINNNNNNNS